MAASLYYSQPRRYSTNGAARDLIGLAVPAAFGGYLLGVTTGDRMALHSADLLVMNSAHRMERASPFDMRGVPVTPSAPGVVDPHSRHLPSAGAW